MYPFELALAVKLFLIHGDPDPVSLLLYLLIGRVEQCSRTEIYYLTDLVLVKRSDK